MQSAYVYRSEKSKLSSLNFPPKSNERLPKSSKGEKDSKSKPTRYALAAYAEDNFRSSTSYADIIKYTPVSMIQGYGGDTLYNDNIAVSYITVYSEFGR